MTSSWTLQSKKKRNTKDINISCCNISILPNLSKFTFLKILNISHNNLINFDNFDLNSLIHLQTLDCSHNNLTHLPFLQNLKVLNCSFNKLTYIQLNHSLVSLICSNNNLTHLKSMPHMKLQFINCAYNKLTYLPVLNNLIHLECSKNLLTTLPNDLNLNKIGKIQCYYNPIMNQIIGNLFINPRFYIYYYDLHNDGITKNKINKWNHFREFYFLSKLQKKFISWMWKSRETKIKEQFHPKHLHHFLEKNNISQDDGEEMDKFLNLDKWD